jgi:RimJ/RimL family protein N-acetyltransferase
MMTLVTSMHNVERYAWTKIAHHKYLRSSGESNDVKTFNMYSLFQSERLTYRAFRQSDLEDLYILWNDPSIQLGSSPDAIRPFADNMKDKFKTWGESFALWVAAVDTETDEFVGFVSMVWEPAGPSRDASLSMAVKHVKWNKGYGTEICAWAVAHTFKYLGAHRVSLAAFASNPAALAVYKKVYASSNAALNRLDGANTRSSGFVQEGCKRKARFVNGGWDDVLFMGILDEDFFENNRESA